MAVKALIKKVLKLFIKKDAAGSYTFLRVLGFLRVPYQTHDERTDVCVRRYIRILGVEFQCKKLPLPTPAPHESYAFEPMPPMLSFAMEEKLSPAYKQHYCEQKAYKQLGYFPNLKEPRSLNEKIIWLALHYKNPDIAVAADKTRAKDWMAGRVSPEHLVPTLGVYEDVNDIDFGALPDRFAAKLNDGWGGEDVLLVRDKNDLDLDHTRALLSSWLFPWKNYYYNNLCVTDEKMPRPAILIEEYLDQPGGLNDYKFYCCNGEPKFALVVAGRGTDHQSRAFVDMDWQPLPVARLGMAVGGDPQRPQCLDTMLDLCRRLSAGFPFVRVDLYEVNGRVYVGEMTFTPGMFLPFSSKEWDFRLGEYLKLPDPNA